MRTLKTVKEDVRKLVCICCDKCGRSCIGPYGNFCGISFVISGSYDSPIFGDSEEEIHIDICEYCADEWIKTWKMDYLKSKPVR